MFAFGTRFYMWIERGSLIIIEALFPFGCARRTTPMSNNRSHTTAAAAANMKLLPISLLITTLIRNEWIQKKTKRERERNNVFFLSRAERQTDEQREHTDNGASV